LGEPTAMHLEYKPDFDDAVRRWDAFWQGEMIDRPCLHIVVPKDGRDPATMPGQLTGLNMGYGKAVEMYEEYAASHVFLAEAIPQFRPGFGPDQFAAFFGAKLHVSPDSVDTSWVEPFVEAWDEALPLRLDQNNPMWQAILEFTRTAAELSDGKFLVGQLDYHSNMDCLAALRGPARLCMDLSDIPETIERAMAQVRPYFGISYDAILEAGKMIHGTVTWTQFFSRGKVGTTQCDFICLISPAMARRFVIPALEEEAAHLDHCVYHYDGPDALAHLEAICAIKNIDVIQWVQGAGRGDHVDWIDLLKRFQSKGKGLQVRGTPEQVKRLHRELDPTGAFYIVNGVESEREGRELIEWFERNT